ncbi:MAG TPA: hypothetical protein VJ850_08445 [Candidatus Limnocylindrales bacterium]|nr:hypothetical protein [Candidatus Limnocylindrales bacterium]
MRDQVLLIQSSIRIRADGHTPIVDAIGAYYGRSFGSIEEALGIDDYVVVDRNEANDITGIERDTMDDSFAGPPIWDALAPWVDAGNFLAYRQTYDGLTYRVVFDGHGGYEET